MNPLFFLFLSLAEKTRGGMMGVPSDTFPYDPDDIFSLSYEDGLNNIVVPTRGNADWGDSLSDFMPADPVPDHTVCLADGTWIALNYNL